MNLGEIIFSHHIILSAIFIFLITLSIASWYLIFRKILFFFSEENSLKNNKNTDSLSSNLVNEALKIIKNNSKNQDLAKRKINLLFENFKNHLSFGQNLLASIANLTPFIGLFGTVIGVYFALIDISNQGSANIAVVAKPIGEALIATAFGLWCAIPASFAFNFFAKRSANLLKKIQIVIEEKSIELEEK